jgi:hypothetical protein
MEIPMSTRVSTNTSLRAACAAVAHEKLNLAAAATLDLSGLTAAVTTTGRIGLTELNQMISAEPVRITLSGLAPAAFEGVRQILANPHAGAGREAAAASAQASLALAVTQASAKIGTVTRDITANAFAETGAELGYKVNVCRGDVATGIEMRRGHEIVLMRVDDSGRVESDHAGLNDSSCGDRQRELEAGAARKGVIVTDRDEQHHGSASGGMLIRTAAARQDPSLARAVALGAQPVPPGPRRALSEEPERRRTARRAGGRP